MTHHQHSFSVDSACDCGVMLSEYTRNLAKSNAELTQAASDFLDAICNMTTEEFSQGADHPTRIKLIAALRKIQEQNP